MSDVEVEFHQTWLGLVQPIEGLVVSIPVLVDAQCIARNPPSLQQRFHDLAPVFRRGKEGQEYRRVQDLGKLFSELLELSPELFDTGAALPDELSLYVPEGKQTIRPTMALRHVSPPAEKAPPAGDETPQTRAGLPYVMLVWDLPRGLSLDKAETTTGPWEYPPAAKFDRLLRACRVPIGLIGNGEVVRLVYAPHGESTGAITFRVDDMASVGGRPILDAFVMLLSATRFFGVAEEHQLPKILENSRKRQANVTNALAGQVFEALGILLSGFEAAAERDGDTILRDALERSGDHVYGGLLTVLLRLVFLLYAEDRGLLPMEHSYYAGHLSVLGLFEKLQRDHGNYPDSMARRFGAWARLVTLFRALFLGARHDDLHLPARRGRLFDPEVYPFLEGWSGTGGAPINDPGSRAAVRVPTVSDETIFRVIEKLLVLEGQRLSYRALDVEQIGSVYEALMGYHVVRSSGDAVCLRPERVWVSASEVLEQPPARRVSWLEEEAGLAKSALGKVGPQIAAAKTEGEVLSLLDGLKVKGSARARAGQLVIQPGAERRRTSSHYTPRSLSAPIVARTLEPLLLSMGEAPPSERLLNLKVCDPAMGSGAFLVEACRFLADQVVAAWTREGKLAGDREDPVLRARRLVAQRCLYGVDKNPFAVDLAKLSMWLVTLAKEEPFTFVDHALRHGDSLVGLDFEQIKAFHWKPSAQRSFFEGVVREALDDAIGARQRILELAAEEGDDRTREKERLLWDAEDALERVKLLGDLVVGAFFAHEKDKEREAERKRRLDLVNAWLTNHRDEPAPEELRRMQAEVREKLPVFHWMVEFPEVFYAERPDPLDGDRVSGAAWMDSFVGNPPFLGGKRISTEHGGQYAEWLEALFSTSKNTDLSAHFFRLGERLLGKSGTVGFVATNTIAQGDTRASGLKALLEAGCTIYHAIRMMLWEGDAKVAFAVAIVAKGNVVRHLATKRLDGVPVTEINSYLRPKPERKDPFSLKQNESCSFNGAFLRGTGFLMTPEEHGDLLRRDPRNGEVTFPYLGGDELNSNPDQSFERYVIDFSEMSLDRAREWPDLLAIVEARIKPERDRLKDTGDDAIHKKYWWRFARARPELREAIREAKRCLVNSQVSKHLIFGWQSPKIVFGHTMNVFAFEDDSQFAVMQSRAHEVWARLLSSSFGSWPAPVLRYSPSDCFGTFPFPNSSPRSSQPSLEPIGAKLYETRGHYAIKNDVGLTITYNRLKDPQNDEPAIIELRRLHEDMDRAVLEAYGWTELVDLVPPYTTPTTDAEKRAYERFEDEVIDKLFALNAERAAEEKRLGAGAAGKGKKEAKGGAKAGGKGKKKGGDGGGQMSLI